VSTKVEVSFNAVELRLLATVRSNLIPIVRQVKTISIDIYTNDDDNEHLENSQFCRPERTMPSGSGEYDGHEADRLFQKRARRTDLIF
jgi:hypothetical protein